MRILLTGAAGFIGSHITRDLLGRGHEVVGLDDLSTGSIENLPSHPHWGFVKGDIRDPSTCLSAMAGCEGVVHLAGRNSVPRSLADPGSAMEVNVMGGFNLLEAARARGVKRFVYASSSSVYGDDPALPKVETARRQPLSPYAASKASFEHLASAWARSWGLQTLGLRFFNVFGPRQSPEGAYAAVFPKFVQAGLEGGRPTIHGDGSFSRDFTYVDNVVGAVRGALSTKTILQGQVVNIACGDQITVLRLWESIAAEVGVVTKPVFGPPRTGDMPHSRADIHRAQQLIGYAPQVSFEEGVRLTVAWYRANWRKA